MPTKTPTPPPTVDTSADYVPYCNTSLIDMMINAFPGTEILIEPNDITASHIGGTWAVKDRKTGKILMTWSCVKYNKYNDRSYWQQVYPDPNK